MSLRLPLLVPSLLLGAGCAASGDTGNAKDTFDGDGDGLYASFEAEVGTSDGEADSDGDGCSDAVEVLGHFDPVDPVDRPYIGGYPRGPRPADAAFEALAAEHGEAFETGALNPNWTLTDQHGEEVELRDFYGQVVFVELVSEWCVPCQEASPKYEAFYQENKERGFVILQIVLEGVQNNEEPDVERWVEAFGLTFPVLVDYSPGDYTVTDVAQYYLDVPGAEYSIPNFTLIDREQRIQELYVLGDLEDVSTDLARVEALIEAPVPDVAPLLPDNADALREELGMDADSWVTPASLCGGGE